MNEPEASSPHAEKTAPAALARRRGRVAALAFIALAFLGLGYYLSDVLNPFLIGLLIAYVLNPVVEALERRGVRRRFAVTVLFGVVLCALVLAVGWGATEGAAHFDDLRRELAGEPLLDSNDPRVRAESVAHLGSMAPVGPSAIGKIQQPGEPVRYFLDENFDGVRQVGVIERIGSALGPRLRRISTEQVESLARALEAQAGQALQFGAQASRGLGAFLSTLGNFFGYVLLVPVYTFFLLLSLSDLRERVRELLPGRYRPRILDITAKIDRSLAAFFRGRLAIALLKGIVTWLGLWIVGVPFAFFIGMIAAALSIIPFLGPIVGGALALALAYEGGGSYGARAAGVVVAFVAAEGLETVLFPVLIGREVGLHPLALILSLFAFGKLFGLFGVLLAVPFACILKILLAELALPTLRQLAQEPPET